MRPRVLRGRAASATPFATCNPRPDLKKDAYTAKDVVRAVIRGPDRSRDLENPRVAGGGAKVSSFGVAPLPDTGPGARVTLGIRSYFTGGW